MTETPENASPKIIVDSDWKEQVAREKEMAAESAVDAKASNDANASGDSRTTTAIEPNQPDSASPSIADADVGELPPPGLEHIVSVFFTQALMFLGQMPTGNKSEPEPANKPMAKHVIDTLDVLSEKTKGNTTEDEAKMLQNVLHALRMAYVNAK